MKRIRYSLMIATALLVAVPALGADEAPAAADAPPATQDAEADTGGRPGAFYFEISEWFSQPLGTEYRWATIYQQEDPRGGAVQTVHHGTQENERWRLGWIFKNPAYGRVYVTYWSNADFSDEQRGFPGQFVIGESATLPVFAGAFDDGFADLAAVATATKIRDTRLDWGWTIAQSGKMEAIALIGARFVDHSRSMDTDYFGWDADFPFVGTGASERLDLVPQPDVSSTDSNFSGRGFDFGLEMRFALHPKIRVDATVSAAILRGSTDAAYSWSNALYVIQTGGGTAYVDPDDLGDLLDDPATEPLISQTRVGSALHEDGASETSWVVDASLALHGEVYRGIEVFGGFRGSHYDRVGADLRADPDSLEGYTRTPRSVGYEGFFVGMSFRF